MSNYYYKEPCVSHNTDNHALAQQLLGLRKENTNKQRKVQEVVASSKELDQIKRYISESYTAKERARQVDELNHKKVKETILESELNA